MTWLQSLYNAPFLLALLVGFGLVLAGLVGALGDGDDFDAEPDVRLGWLGVGRAPVTLLLQTLLLTFGACGLCVSALVADVWGQTGPGLLLGGLLGGLPAALVTTSFVGRLFQRFLPQEREVGKDPGRLVGQVGKVAALTTGDFGQVLVEAAGDCALVNACSSGAHLERGVPVLVTAYDPVRRLYVVVPSSEV